MGCAASSEQSARGGQVRREEKDPDDLELDPVEMKETKITSFDDFFANASAPLNSLVDMNNDVNGALNEVKAAVAKILNAYTVEVHLGKDTDTVRMDVLNKQGAVAQVKDVQDLLKNPPEGLLVADTDLSMAAKTLREALEKAPGENSLAVSEAGGVTTASQDPGVKSAVENYTEKVKAFRAELDKLGGFSVRLRVEAADQGSERTMKASLKKFADPDADEPESVPVTFLDVLRAKGSPEILSASACVEEKAKALARELKKEELKEEAVVVETRKLAVPKYTGKELNTKRDYQTSVVNCNSALFKLSKHCMVVNGEVGIAQAVKEVVKSIKDEALKAAKTTAIDSAKESFKINPKLDIKEDGSFDFDIEYSIDPSIAPAPFSPDLLPKKARVAWDAILSVKAAVTAVVEGVPAVKEQLEKLTDESKELASKVKDEAMGSGLGIGDALAAAKGTAANIKALTSGPNIINTVLDSCKRVVDEFKKAAEMAAA